MSEIEKPLAHESCLKMLLYGIGVMGVRYVVWPKMAKVGGTFSKTAIKKPFAHKSNVPKCSYMA